MVFMLNNMTIGFIGAGMMAEAIARGLIGSEIEPQRIIAFDPASSAVTSSARNWVQRERKAMRMSLRSQISLSSR